MKTPSFFKLNTSTVTRLEAAQAYSERLGQKMTKTDLVERAIQMLATSDDEVRGKIVSREQPVPPLLQSYRSWKAGDGLSRGQYLQLAHAAHASYKRHAGLINTKYLVDILKAAQAVVALRRPQNAAYDLEQLDSHYRSCLYERRATLLESFNATIEKVQHVDFGATPEFSARVLVSALRDEPPIDDRLVDEALKPYQESLFRLAIRSYWMETGKQFVDPDVAEPSPSKYWANCYVSRDFAFKDFRLEWGADHNTSGLMLRADLQGASAIYEFRSFVDVTDFICLSNNLIFGGSGGERGALLLAKTLDVSSESYTDFKVSNAGSRMGFRLDDLALQELLACVTALQSDDVFSERYKLLAEVYGDV